MTQQCGTAQIKDKNGLTGSEELINLKFEYGDFDENDGKDIKITLSLDESSNSGTEDLIGVAFDVLSTSGLRISDIQTKKLTTNGSLSTFDPEVYIAQGLISDDPVTPNSLLYVDPGFSTSGDSNPGSPASKEPYDIGIKFSKQGSGEGIVQEASFVIASENNEDLDLSLLSGGDWWVRLQSTDGGEGSSKMYLNGLVIEDCPDNPPPPKEKGMAQSPGFWKNHQDLWIGYLPSNNFKDIFGIAETYDFNSKLEGDQSTLLDAITARGSGVNGLARAGTAALLNAAAGEATDPVTGIAYIYTDDEALAIGLSSVFGDGLTQEEKENVIDTLEAIDTVYDGVISVSEVISAVQTLIDSNPTKQGLVELATAFDVLNNMPHLDASAFA